MDQLVLRLVLCIRFLICIYYYFGLLVDRIGSCWILLVYGNGLFKVGFGEGVCRPVFKFG